MPTEQPDTLRWSQKAFIALQYFLPQIALTRLVGWLMQRESRWLKNTIINGFVKSFSVNTNEAEKPVPDGYPSMNAFFTRALRAGARQVDQAADSIVAPCDGVVSQCGVINDGRLIQAKGFKYQCSELLADDDAREYYDGGQFMTIYLAPYDYHRVHTPMAGRIVTHRHVPGALFSVNQVTAAAVPRLFARNERRVFEINDGQSVTALVMVGALNVGSISTVWDDALDAGSLNYISKRKLPDTAFEKGATLGWFNMGSTVILLWPRGYAQWSETHAAGDVLRMGDVIALRRID
ncbi:MAG: archaetidylserine decarboxylase [Pseudomonadota bacterium]